MHARRAACAAVVAAIALPAAGAASASAQAPGFQGEARGHAHKDARDGRKAPTTRQRSAAARSGGDVRFNALGTPRTVTRDGAALATGLPSGAEAAARAYLRGAEDLFGLSDAEVADLELVSIAPLGAGSAVLLRQRLGSVRAGVDGLVTVAVRDGKALFASSSLTRDTSAPPAATVGEAQAALAAARDAGRSLSAADLTDRREQDGWTVFTARGIGEPIRVRRVAVPTAQDGNRPAHEVVVIDDTAGHPLGVASFVDARTGGVLVREDLVDHAVDNPTWDVFPNAPSTDHSSADTRQLWCWNPGAPGCQAAQVNPSSPAWDLDARKDRPTFETRGNNARGTEKWLTNDTAAQGKNYTRSETRDYAFPWTNQWFEQGCNPSTFSSPQRNDIDAATANLFAMHNRMHDWSYKLGFTETAFNMQEFNFGRGGRDKDPEHGNSQAGGIVGGAPAFASRDNANQITPPDGVAPTTNMYLWQPIAGSFYAPCVDGDYDMSVIGHEYTHAISNRMVAGPDARLTGAQANALGESWSDLTAIEYLHEHGFVPAGGENPWAVGPYATGDKVSGIRNYGMNVSPLNYSDVGYDLTGPQVHADGEIWTATNYRIREAFNAAYDGSFPSSDAALQLRCARGETPVAQCPGNRRWIQLVFDAWLLMARGDVSMVDARDAMIAADQVRFGGADRALLWNTFASRGLGEDASSAGVSDGDPKPGFASPTATEGRIAFAPRTESGGPAAAQLFVGSYEARATPVADSIAGTALGSEVALVPGRYELLIRGDGFGTTRTTVDVAAGQTLQLTDMLQANRASAARGATATGDGTNLGKLIDETEATQWASLGRPVQGRQVTVRLDPSRPSVQVRRVQVSALLRPTDPADTGDPGSQARVSALRSFELLACDASSGGPCATDADFRVVYTSPADAFPSVAPRPRVPELIMRSFTIPRTKATHLRLRVVDNQCTGAPDYQGEQDQDPTAVTDCSDGTTQDENVRAAELQAFEG
ncbi:MAG TPA: M36 family metallopeptidase [Solirubrobacteraceae bacterium]|nr:M36 family metallopeptidase [Solirubrobacteraceae bacterium]